MKQNRVSRILQLLTVLQARPRYTAADLAAALGTSRRTVFRDLRCLGEAGMQYRFQPNRGRYAADSSFLLPPPALTPQEAFALLFMIHMASNSPEFPLRSAAAAAGLKIEGSLSADTRKYCNEALRAVSMQPGPRPQQELLSSVFKQIHNAIVNKRAISIRYFSPTEKRQASMDFYPYRLLYSRQTWYVLGTAGSDAHVSPVNLNHIRQVTLLGSNCNPQVPFDLRDYLGRAWSVLPEGRLYEVKLRFLPETAYEVAKVQWHETQTVRFEDDGSAIIEFRVDGLSEITWWILSYGDQVEVLAPRLLRQRIVQIARKIAEPSKSVSGDQ